MKRVVFMTEAGCKNVGFVLTEADLTDITCSGREWTPTADELLQETLAELSCGLSSLLDTPIQLNRIGFKYVPEAEEAELPNLCLGLLRLGCLPVLLTEDTLTQARKGWTTGLTHVRLVRDEDAIDALAAVLQPGVEVSLTD